MYFLMQHAIAQTPPGSVILVDGFPRSLPQAQKAEAAMGRPLAVLFFDCSEDTMKVCVSIIAILI
jgi:adenylate kinase family enzyme